jgi:hypothetical protein
MLLALRYPKTLLFTDQTAPFQPKRPYYESHCYGLLESYKIICNLCLKCNMALFDIEKAACVLETVTLKKLVKCV